MRKCREYSLPLRELQFSCSMEQKLFHMDGVKLDDNEPP
jgi:hypothetical protein